VLLRLPGKSGAARGVGRRAAGVLAPPAAGATGLATRRALRRGTRVARRGFFGAVGARTDLVVEPHGEGDALARLVDLQNLDADDVAGLGDVARILDEGFCHRRAVHATVL